MSSLYKKSSASWPAGFYVGENAEVLGVSAAGIRLQRLVQVIGGADQTEVGERLGEIPQEAAGRAQAFGVKPEMVGIAEHLFKVPARLANIPGTGQRFHIPEA